MSFSHKRSALTMIELIFVIIILGIVSSIGAEIIADTYESYIVQRAEYRATMKTELALNQIANRLRYAIPGTVGARTTKGAPFVPITSVVNPNNRVLQWVAYDGDSFEAITSNADLALANTIIGNLGGNIANAVIYFPNDPTTAYGIGGGAGESITLDTAIPAGKVYERYKLAWSSYALEVDGSNDLVLHYRFSPAYSAAIQNESSSILLHNVTNFRFLGSEGSIRVKICKKEPIDNNTNSMAHACKEKVIF